MTRSKALLVAALTVGIASAVNAQQPPAPATPPPLPQAPDMTFFVTGNGPGKGGDLGGIEGADQHCQMLAQRHGAGGKTWRAYLSTQEAAGSRRSTRAIASATARGRTSKARSLRPVSTICIATTTSLASTIR